jgi:hypothetical protein
MDTAVSLADAAKKAVKLANEGVAA